MKVKLFSAVIALLLSTGFAMAQSPRYTTVPGDPMKTRIYTLSNGLKVYLSVNKEKPRVQTYIAVNTGSRNDPAETTGLAHYLEHIMFKGTTNFGTSNLQAEKPLLDSIESRFEQYRHITDPVARKNWYHKIDSLSQLAAKYNIPNEYDKMMASIGSEGSNAFTGDDQTCYVEDIPSNEIATWARVQSDRFKNMVIRGFHTELEAVYEEYNISLSRDMDKMWTALSKKLFPNHPYGTQTTIGTQEHLKNPSIVNIKNYFHKYYVPNNIAIVMAGDFDPDNVIAIIEKYFGDWKPSQRVDRPEYAPVPNLTHHVDTTVVGQEAENVLIAWKFDRGASLQIDTLDVISDILSNGKAGLFDVDLNIPLKVMGASAFINPLHDYSTLILSGTPNEGQSLEEVRNLLIKEIEKLKKGDFDESLIKAVIANQRRRFLQRLDENRARVSQMTDAFILGKDWKQEVEKFDRIAKITKTQLVAFANRHLTDGYVCVFKRMGEDTTIHKIEKPTITPIPTNADKQSDFLKEVVSTEVEPIQPHFLNFNTDLAKANINKQTKLLYKQNESDELFRLELDFPVGTEINKKLTYAADLFNYAGIKGMNATAIGKKFYTMACDFSINVGIKHTRFILSGLNENLKEALSLFMRLINTGTISREDYLKDVATFVKAHNDAKKKQNSNFFALLDYAQMGSFNPSTSNMTPAELEATDGNKLMNEIRMLAQQFPMTVLYYGPSTQQEITQMVKQNCLPKTFRAAQTADKKRFIMQTTPQNEIYLAPYDAKNIYMVQYNNDNRTWTPANEPLNALFNEYFGGSMNAIVFQELREARALAYSAGARYYTPVYKGNPEYFTTRIITQNDKMMDCITAFNDLLNNMPQRQAGLDLAKQSLMKSLATARTTKFGVLRAYMSALDKGIDYDISKNVYEGIPSLTLQDLVSFARERISGKAYRYVILGDEKNLDMKSLEKIAPIKRLTTDQIFGY